MYPQLAEYSAKCIDCESLYGVKNLTMGINLRRRLSLVIVDDASQDISPPYWTISVLFSSWSRYRKSLTDPLMWTSMIVVFKGKTAQPEKAFVGSTHTYPPENALNSLFDRRLFAFSSEVGKAF